MKLMGQSPKSNASTDVRVFKFMPVLRKSQLFFEKNCLAENSDAFR